MIQLFEGYDDDGDVHPNLYIIYVNIYYIHVDNDNHFFS